MRQIWSLESLILQKDFILINHILLLGKCIFTLGDARIGYEHFEVSLLAQDASKILSNIMLLRRETRFLKIFINVKS